MASTPAKRLGLQDPFGPLALDGDWPDLLAALRPGIKSGKPAERARAAIGYLQLVYGRQLQKEDNEQPADVDPLGVASMTREQRDELKRKLLAQHPHLVDELGLDPG